MPTVRAASAPARSWLTHCPEIVACHNPAAAVADGINPVNEQLLQVWSEEGSARKMISSCSSGSSSGLRGWQHLPPGLELRLRACHPSRCSSTPIAASGWPSRAKSPPTGDADMRWPPAALPRLHKRGSPPQQRLDGLAWSSSGKRGLVDAGGARGVRADEEALGGALRLDN